MKHNRCFPPNTSLPDFGSGVVFQQIEDVKNAWLTGFRCHKASGKPTSIDQCSPSQPSGLPRCFQPSELADFFF